MRTLQALGKWCLMCQTPNKFIGKRIKIQICWNMGMSKYWVTPAPRWEFGRISSKRLLSCLLFLVLQNKWAPGFMSEKIMEQGSAGAGEKAVPRVIWCHGNTIWWPKSPDGAIVHTIGVRVWPLHTLWRDVVGFLFETSCWCWGGLPSPFVPTLTKAAVGNKPSLGTALLTPAPKVGTALVLF